MICMRIEIYACEIPQTKVVTTKATTTGMYKLFSIADFKLWYKNTSKAVLKEV